MKIDKKEVLDLVRAHVKVDVDLDGLGVKLVERLAEPLADSVLASICKAIPGGWDDALTASVKPQIYAEAKEALAKALAKVEDKIEDVIEGKKDEAQV